MDHFVKRLRFFPSAVYAVFVRNSGIESLDVQILNVGAVVGESPGDAVIVTDDHERCSGKRKACNIPSRGGEMNLVPDRGNAQLEVCIVGEQRFSGGGVRAADNPIVASQGAPNFTVCAGQKIAHYGPQHRSNTWRDFVFTGGIGLRFCALMTSSDSISSSSSSSSPL